jgi:hypothetical protein
LSDYKLRVSKIFPLFNCILKESIARARGVWVVIPEGPEGRDLVRLSFGGERGVEETEREGGGVRVEGGGGREI